MGKADWIARLEANGLGGLTGLFARGAGNDENTHISYSKGTDLGYGTPGEDYYTLSRNVHTGTGTFEREDISFRLENGAFNNNIWIGHGSDYRSGLVPEWAGYKNQGLVTSEGNGSLTVSDNGGMLLRKSDRGNYVLAESDTTSPVLRQYIQANSGYAVQSVNLDNLDPQQNRQVLAHTIRDIVKQTGFPDDAPADVQTVVRQLYDEAEADYQRSLAKPALTAKTQPALDPAAPAPSS